jgi:hypothetical protein
MPRDDETEFETTSELRRGPVPPPADSAERRQLPSNRSAMLMVALATLLIFVALVVYFLVR